MDQSALRFQFKKKATLLIKDGRLLTDKRALGIIKPIIHVFITTHQYQKGVRKKNTEAQAGTRGKSLRGESKSHREEKRTSRR